MKIVTVVLRCFFWLLIFALLIIPLILINTISERELELYQAPDPPQFITTAYGSVAKAERMDIPEAITVSGVFVSDTSEYQELNYYSPSRIRWDIDVGQEVHEGQVLGTYRGKEIISQYTGVVSEINVYTEDAYIKIKLLSPILLECNVSSKVLTALQHATALTTEENETVSVKYISQVRNTDGSTLVRLQIESSSYAYGEALNELKLYTGYSFLQALVLPENCLYQKTAGEDEPWYVYEVNPDGTMIGERIVERGYSDGTNVCVTGIEIGQYFDTGYKAIAEGGTP